MAIKPIEEMIRPVSRGDDVLEKLKKNDPDKELRDKGILPPLQKYAMSDPDPMAEKWDMYQDMIKDGRYKGTWEDFLLDFEDAVDIPYAAKDGQQGIMQLASGLDIQALSLDELKLKADALNWAMKTLGRNSWAEVLEDSDMQGVLNAYQDAGGMD